MGGSRHISLLSLNLTYVRVADYAPGTTGRHISVIHPSTGRGGIAGH
jgi:hypothetical protein